MDKRRLIIDSINEYEDKILILKNCISVLKLELFKLDMMDKDEPAN